MMLARGSTCTLFFWAVPWWRLTAVVQYLRHYIPGKINQILRQYLPCSSNPLHTDDLCGNLLAVKCICLQPTKRIVKLCYSSFWCAEHPSNLNWCHYFESSFFQLWQKSYMLVTKFSLTRCYGCYKSLPLGLYQDAAKEVPCSPEFLDYCYPVKIRSCKFIFQSDNWFKGNMEPCAKIIQCLHL